MRVTVRPATDKFLVFAVASQILSQVARRVAYILGLMHGILDTQKGSRGYRWTWTSPGGASYIGPTPHRTKKDAIAAGNAWLAARQ